MSYFDVLGLVENGAEGLTKLEWIWVALDSDGCDVFISFLILFEGHS